jgi:hypothetical protein
MRLQLDEQDVDLLILENRLEIEVDVFSTPGGDESSEQGSWNESGVQISLSPVSQPVACGLPSSESEHLAPRFRLS